MYFSIPRHKFDFIKHYSPILRYKSFIPRYTGISYNFLYVLMLEKFLDAASILKYKCISSHTYVTLEHQVNRQVLRNAKTITGTEMAKSHLVTIWVGRFSMVGVTGNTFIFGN